MLQQAYHSGAHIDQLYPHRTVLHLHQLLYHILICLSKECEIQEQRGCRQKALTCTICDVSCLHTN